jgi:dTDP-4-amino-4,6-dideoxygalactose transaminase
LGPGDEVITTPHTFFATAESMIHIGIKPVFVDVDPDTHGLDPKLIEKAITPRTKAVVPVHIYGSPCDMRAIREICVKHQLLLIEDCAQSHFAKVDGAYVGSESDGAAFSFYPGKNLGAAGDAGFLFAPTKDIAEKCKKIIDHGRLEKYLHDTVGFNHRMDGLQAAFLMVKMDEVQAWTNRRVELAERYRDQLKDFKLPSSAPGADPVYHLFVVEAANRDEILGALKTEGIQGGIHYPVPLHLQPALIGLGYREGMFPSAERISKRVLSLPICPELTNAELDTVVRVFKKVAKP